MAEKKLTEKESRYDHLEKMKPADLLAAMNAEDARVARAVKKALPQITRLVQAASQKMSAGGRMFYIGAGTSGRLGVLDAAECPPTFGVAPGKVIGIIAGGDRALREAVEFAEDDRKQGWLDLQAKRITKKDILIGISAGGTTPYVLAAMEAAKKKGIVLGCITCNPGTPMAALADLPVEVITGPEFVTGSTRLKAGSATKMVLNMLSTSVMTRLGHVKGNRMVDLMLNSEKLEDRAVRIIMKELGIERAAATALLKKHGSVRKAITRKRS